MNEKHSPRALQAHNAPGAKVENVDLIRGTITLSAAGLRVTILPCSVRAIEAVRSIILRFQETGTLPKFEVAYAANGGRAIAGGTLTLRALGVRMLNPA